MISLFLVSIDELYYAFIGERLIRDSLDLVIAGCAELYLELLLISFLVPAVVGG